MHVSRLSLYNFRNCEEISMAPDPALNIILGKNAQGKTSLLEAIYVAATSRSWRAGKDSELIRWEADQAWIAAEIAREEQNDVVLEVVLSRSEKKQIKVNTIRQTRLAGLLGQANVVLIEPHDVEIVRGDPSRRRRFLNLEISQIQPQYCHLLLNYRKVVEQRNRLLKDLQGRRSGDGVLDVWNEQLVSYGARMLERRLAFVKHVGELARVIHSQITEGGEALEVRYSSGTDLSGAETAAELGGRLRGHLEELRGEEIGRGMTLVGPHRDDLVLTVNGVDARVYGSHGQQRTIALGLRLAELEVMEETAKEPPIILLDDVMTDLDEERRAHAFGMTRGRCQTFVTAASRGLFDREFLARGRIYRVSGGQVTVE